MNIVKKSLCIAIGFALSIAVSAADTCDGKGATRVIDTDDFRETIWLYGTSGTDVWVVKGSRYANLVVFFDLQAAHTAVDDAPKGSGSGGHDKICITHSEVSASIFIRGEYKSYVKTNGYNLYLMTNQAGKAGSVKFIADYQGYGQHNYYVLGSKGNDSVTVNVPNSFLGFSKISTFSGQDNVLLDEAQRAGGNYVSGGSGDDLIAGSGSNDLIIGGTGKDTIYGNGGDDLLIGADAALTIESIGSVYSEAAYIYNDGPKYAYEAGVIEVISGDRSGSKIYGGDGDDVIMGSDGSDDIEGNQGNDWIYGLEGSDNIHLGAKKNDNGTYSWKMADGSRTGSFTIETEADRDGGIVDGGKGNDMIWGSDSTDTLIGDEGADRLFGMGGNDSLRVGTCSGGDNYSYGMDGSDSISYCSGDWVFTGANSGFIAR